LTQEGVLWAITKYDKKIINNRELLVTVIVEAQHIGRIQQAAKWEPPNLAQISETADVDEDLEQESSAENINLTMLHQNYPNPQSQSEGLVSNPSMQTIQKHNIQEVNGIQLSRQVA
jgi:hypothetical protein